MYTSNIRLFSRNPKYMKNSPNFTLTYNLLLAENGFQNDALLNLLALIGQRIRRQHFENQPELIF